MRNFSFIGLLLTVAIIGWMAKGYLAPAVSHDPNDRSTIEYWVAHPTDRATMLQWCQQHPQQQDSGECQLATAAQMKVDQEGQPSSGSQSGGAQPGNQNHGVDQGTGQASDELQAQQDSNALDPGGQ